MSVGISVAYGAMFSAIALTGVAAGAKAHPGDPVIAVFVPGTPIRAVLDAIDHAGAQVSGFGATDWIIALAPTNRFVHAALHEMGAVLLLNADLAAGVCGVRLLEYGVSGP